MTAFLVAALVFAAVAVLVVGTWRMSLPRQRVRARLQSLGQGVEDLDSAILRKDLPGGARPSLVTRLERLIAQGGYPGTLSDLMIMIGIFSIGGGLIGWFRAGGAVWGLLGAALFGPLPLGYVAFRRYQRIKQLEEQFPDALDMMARSIRAGHALGAAIRGVAEEMPAPVGEEFTKVAEEVRLGGDPTEALFHLEDRAPTEDVAFFCAAIRIQRNTGGNLAEILDRLSEVIRERFKLLSHARVLSAQHRYTACCVGLAPVIFTVIFELMRPGYFKPLLDSPVAPLIIGAGVVLEVIGFFVVWRIATIKV